MRHVDHGEVSTTRARGGRYWEVASYLRDPHDSLPVAVVRITSRSPWTDEELVEIRDRLSTALSHIAGSGGSSDG